MSTVCEDCGMWIVQCSCTYNYNEEPTKIKTEKKIFYTEEDIRKAIDFNKYHTMYGNIIGTKSDDEIEKFIKSLKQ
jgi:hypothetical protein